MGTVTNESDGFAPPPAPQVVAVGTNAADQTTIVSRRQRFNTAGVVCAVAGAAILIFGLVQKPPVKTGVKAGGQGSSPERMQAEASRPPCSGLNSARWTRPFIPATKALAHPMRPG